MIPKRPLLKRLRTRLALRLASWIVPEVALQEVELALSAMPKGDRHTSTATLLRTMAATYRRQAEERRDNHGI